MVTLNCKLLCQAKVSPKTKFFIKLPFLFYPFYFTTLRLHFVFSVHRAVLLKMCFCAYICDSIKFTIANKRNEFSLMLLCFVGNDTRAKNPKKLMQSLSQTSCFNC